MVQLNKTGDEVGGAKLHEGYIQKNRELDRSGTEEKFEWKVKPQEKMRFPGEGISKKVSTELQETPIFNGQTPQKSLQ